jgi:DNA (cytosine-5)-methyltransferase 1
MSIVKKTDQTKNRSKVLPEKIFCEFFAGIGLVRAGLEKSGWQCMYANDIDPKKEELYSARFNGDKHFHLGDVWETDNVVNIIKGKPFLATASFPCIDLSLAGHCRGLEGKHSSTFFAFTNALKALGKRKPNLLMIENVMGLITSRDGGDFTAIVQTLADCGYWLDTFLLDAKYFVPQSRPRIFIIGLHEKVSNPLVIRSSKQFRLNDPWQSAIEAYKQIRPDSLIHLMKTIDLPTGWMATPIIPPPMRQKKLIDLINLDVDEEWWNKEQVDKHYESMSDLHKSIVKDMLKKTGVYVGTIYRRKRNGTTRAEVRFDGIAGCLRTPRGGSARQIVIVIDNETLKMRWMNPREYARLQGADDYPLVGKKNQQLFGFGDAVCVPVISWIDKHVLTPIYESAIE